MKSSSKFSIAVYEWLKKLPVDEIESPNAKTIISEFREGHYSYQEASQMMEEYCSPAINDYIRQNEDLLDL
jgi:hypothetical protein